MRNIVQRFRFCLCAALLLVPAAVTAQELESPFPAELERDGWFYVTAGVFQRVAEDGSLETLGFGAGGLAWELGRMKGDLARLEALYAEERTSELLDAITALEEGIALTEMELGQASSVPLSSLSWLSGQVEGLGCTLTVTRNATARPDFGGPWASATASFSDGCPTYGCVYSFAYTEAYDDAFTVMVKRDPAIDFRCSYYSVSSSASVGVTASSRAACYSHAFAHVKILDSFGNWVNFTRSAVSYECTTNPCLSGGDGGVIC